MDIKVPANTTATVYLPCPDPKAIKENDISVSRVPGVEFVRCENNTAIYNIQSGKYHFTLPYNHLASGTYMLRKFVCVGFHSSQGEGAAVMRGCHNKNVTKVEGKIEIQSALLLV
jgi:hypothetical protein